MKLSTIAKRAFVSEAALCTHFLAAVPLGWVSYPETGGWDILLVRVADGFQIGIQAKLKLNVAVLVQALEDRYWYYREEGPDCRAVLVPRYASVKGLEQITPYLGLTVIQMTPPEPGHQPYIEPMLPVIEKRWYAMAEDWHELCPLRRHRLPDYIPDVPAGVAGPRHLTHWKIAALRITALLEKRGYVTRADFKVLQIDPRRWVAGRWLIRSPDGLVAGPGLPDFKRRHPTTYAKIVADPSWVLKLPRRRLSIKA